MIKSLTSIRLLIVLILSLILTFGLEVLDFKITPFWGWLVSFSFLLFIMEISRLVVNQVVKKENASFLLFLFFFLIISLGLSFSILSIANIQDQDYFTARIFFGSAILVVGVFQGVYYWIRKNGQERTKLLVQKQAYLQHSFNALKSQNVIEFLQDSLTNTVVLIRKDPSDAVLQIEKLTSILRYLLQSRDEKFVMLGDELKNVKEYCELAELQLGNKVNLSLNITSEFNSTRIPPLVFQMVLDEQFKTFSLGKKEELDIEVYIENAKFVVVKTSLLPSLLSSVKNEKFINNLKQRYQLYNKASGVSELSTATDYFVKFPLVVG